jgi:flagellar assembly factor FliW
MLQIETVRFGRMEVAEDDVIEFGRGILGFESLTRFAHIEREAEAPFGWLQSLDDPTVAFAVANPAIFFPTYEVRVDPRELGDVAPGPNDRLIVLGICTFPGEPSEMRMNLQGPLVVNSATGRGKQLVLNRSPYRTQHRLVEPKLLATTSTGLQSWKPRARLPSA